MDTIGNVHVLEHEARVTPFPTVGDDAPALVRCPLQCMSCAQRAQCLPADLANADVERFDGIVFTRKRVRRGESLYYMEEAFESLFAIRSGSFKGVLTHPDGRSQVTGFFLPGELVGLDGIASQRYRCDAVALEDSEVCVIPFARLERVSRDIPSLQHRLHRVMGREIARDYGMLMLLGVLSAEERVASFLLNLSKRYAARGFSAASFDLRMTRADMGSYLGLKLETVSRALSRLRRDNMIALAGRTIEIKDAQRLQQLLGDYEKRRRPRDAE